MSVLQRHRWKNKKKHNTLWEFESRLFFTHECSTKGPGEVGLFW